MTAFLQRLGALVAGILQGFDRLVFQGNNSTGNTRPV